MIRVRFRSSGLPRTGRTLVLMAAFSAILISADTRTFSKLTRGDGTALCALDLPSKIVIIDQIAKPVTQLLVQSNSDPCIPADVKCALLCRQDVNCMGFNYVSLSGSCQMYSFGPINFVVNVNCDYFTVGCNLDFFCSALTV